MKASLSYERSKPARPAGHSPRASPPFLCLAFPSKHSIPADSQTAQVTPRPFGPGSIDLDRSLIESSSRSVGGMPLRGWLGQVGRKRPPPPPTTAGAVVGRSTRSNACSTHQTTTLACHSIRPLNHATYYDTGYRPLGRAGSTRPLVGRPAEASKRNDDHRPLAKGAASSSSTVA